MRIFKFFKRQNDHLDVDEVLLNDTSEQAIMKIDEQLNNISNYCENIDKLNNSQRTFIIVENLEREINNGGFNQFYFNSSGDYANETIDCLATIGADKTALIVKKANQQWGNGLVNQNRKERQKTLLSIEDEADLTWEECDAKFYEYQDDIAGLLFEFVKLNRKDFE